MQTNSTKKSIFFERISQMIDFYDIKNVNSFAKDYLGYDSSEKINRLKKENANPSFEILNDISNKFEDISVEWLLTGRGSMLKDVALRRLEPSFTSRLSTDRVIQNQAIPLYDIEAAAGLVPLFANKADIKPTGYVDIPNVPKCDGAVHVVGDSMYPILKSGDIVLYKEVNDIANNIFWGEMYLLSIDMDGEEYITIKYIQRSDEGKEYIKLVSQNQHHASKDVSIDRIRALALIKASIRFNAMR